MRRQDMDAAVTDGVTLRTKRRRVDDPCRPRNRCPPGASREHPGAISVDCRVLEEAAEGPIASVGNNAEPCRRSMRLAAQSHPKDVRLQEPTCTTPKDATFGTHSKDLDGVPTAQKCAMALLSPPAPPPYCVADAFLEIELALCRELAGLPLPPTVTHVYNPLEYALPTHRLYVTMYCNANIKTLFLGMNPGPFGMAQTGVPFGDPSIVRDWMRIHGHVGKPAGGEHPRRLVSGFACPRSEVSGTRLWGFIRSRWPRPGDFFQDHFVHNYCPLIFMDKSGKNVTPDQLPANTRKALFAACDKALCAVVDLLRPGTIVGIGAFAKTRADAVTRLTQCKPICSTVLHPSPASPLANRDWEGTAVRQLLALGIPIPPPVQ